MAHAYHSDDAGATFANAPERGKFLACETPRRAFGLAAACRLADDWDGMSADKLFESDPVLFSSSLALQWRAGEGGDYYCSSCKGGQPNKCPQTPPQPEVRGGRSCAVPSGAAEESLNYTTVNVTTYSWVYEWSVEPGAL